MKSYILRVALFSLAYCLFMFFMYLINSRYDSHYTLIMAICIPILLIASIWGLYCYRYLQKMNPGKMDLATFSFHFLRFRRWEKWEWLAKILFAIIIISTLIYVNYDYVAQKGHAFTAGFIVGIIFAVLLSAGVGLSIYYRFYYKNLKKVDRAFREMQELMKEN